MSRRRCDDLIDLAANTGRCLYLPENAIAGIPQDLRCKTVRHARLRGENRFRIDEFRHRLAEAYVAAKIALVKIGMVRSRIRKRGANRKVSVVFDYGSQMRRELCQLLLHEKTQ